MSIQIFLKQTMRAKIRLILNILLLTATAAFFVISANLYQNSTRNLQLVENAYSTIGAMEIYGNVNAQGQLVSASDPASVGNHLLTAFDYDLSPLTNHSAVQSYDWRYRCAAYIPGTTAVDYRFSELANTLIKDPNAVSLRLMRDQIRFTIKSSTPVEVPLQGWTSQNCYYLGINVIESAAGLEYPDVHLAFTQSEREDWIHRYAEALKVLNNSEETDSITFYPDVEYTMSCSFRSCYWLWNPETGKYSYRAQMMGVDFAPDLYSQETGLEYNSRFGEIDIWLNEFEWEGPFFLQRSETIASDPTLAEYWAKAKAAVLWSSQSFPLTLTSDIESIPAWYAGGMYLNEGRMITAEEYASGAQVCMVSAKLADYHGWKIGDTLEMNLYTFDSYQDDEGSQYLYGPWYGKNNDGFFDKGTYTIVGIYGQRELSVPEGVAPEVFYQPGNTIYAPTTSAQNLPPQEEWPLQPSLLTLRLKSGTMADYLKDMETLGLTHEKDSAYTIKFYADDQGYGNVAGPLQEMRRNAKLLLGLSVVLLAVTMILTAFLFSRQHKHSAGILRMLGGSRGQAFSAILACAVAVAAAGGILGTILGGALTQSVGASILGDTAENAAVALHTGASPALMAISGVGCILLFLLLIAIFTATYIGKEPRQLLPENKG